MRQNPTLRGKGQHLYLTPTQAHVLLTNLECILTQPGNNTSHPILCRAAVSNHRDRQGHHEAGERRVTFHHDGNVFLDPVTLFTNTL